ncbi:hypothetical protein [Gracilimonas mengyeensis]|uniref:O-Glycosyl hydrolase n=1 Tax=Gracilimonas mengyeensis TaxID=1302730 RepID=A0A521BV82_9BACT|nr:hypothetical protein [Gracilimonas mengyeensis]SMO51079.1 hypothetical protein SAMN06265219_103131 [Gracilimonas mengyeensis]
MQLKKRSQFVLAVFAGILLLSPILSTEIQAQAEVMAWGNLNGIRVEGQLMEFKATLCTPTPDWSEVRHTAKERHYTDYEREGERQIITPRLDSLFFTETVRDLSKGKAEVKVKVASRADTVIGGAFFCLQFPEDKIAEGGSIEIEGSEALSFNDETEAEGNEVSVSFADMDVSIRAEQSTQIYLKKEAKAEPARIYFALIDGNASDGQTASNTFTLEASGEIYREPVSLQLDASEPGREFIGMGGNFRLQNERVDPKVIDYNLENMRVAYGRVEMPWWFWHAEEDQDPIAQAEAGNIHPRVEAAMTMAQRLHNMGMPVSLGTWFAPEWAIVGERRRGPGPNGERGNLLNQNKIQKIYQSIGDYIWYLKKEYGVEAAAFSFNESDLGIDVRQMPQQHRQFIKGLGEHLAERGLMTKLYLGDTADANGYAFTYPAKNDPSAHKYISAVSFHSWRGWADETLQQWRDISEELNIPVIVGEGSTDAAAWRYNDIFDEATFAMHEINLYLRILSITQAKTILQWQLTSDYSLLKGGGVFGNNEEELQPMQRFWNLKQLASTPKNSFHLPIEDDSETITAAAFGDLSNQKYAVHVVNNGAEREATIHGLPDGVTKLHVYVTDQNRSMERLQTVSVKDGSTTFTAGAWSFTSLFSDSISTN